MLNIVYCKIELKIMAFNFSAILRAPIREYPQQGKLMFREKRKNFIVEQVGRCYRSLGRVQLCECDL